MLLATYTALKERALAIEYISIIKALLLLSRFHSSHYWELNPFNLLCGISMVILCLRSFSLKLLLKTDQISKGFLSDWFFALILRNHFSRWCVLHTYLNLIWRFCCNLGFQVGYSWLSSRFLWYCLLSIHALYSRSVRHQITFLLKGLKLVNHTLKTYLLHNILFFLLFVVNNTVIDTTNPQKLTIDAWFG